MNQTVAVKPVVKKRRNPEEISSQPAKKPSMPIVQLMPPPQKVRKSMISLKSIRFCRQSEKFNHILSFFFVQTINERRTRLEKFLGHLMEKQRALNENIQPLDLSYLLTGRGARRRTTATTNVPHLN